MAEQMGRLLACTPVLGEGVHQGALVGDLSTFGVLLNIFD